MIDPIEPVSACRSCGAAIVWRKTASGKLMPVAVATGESHFRDCPQAKKWSKNKSKNPKVQAVPSDDALPF